MTTRATLSDFFRAIWKDTSGHVYIAYSSGPGDWHKRMYEWPRAEADVIQDVFRLAATNNEVYYGPALFKAAGSTLKENVLGSHVLWADFDGNAPEDWAKSVGDDLLPTVRVRTSGPRNQHAYWVLTEFCENINTLEAKNRSLAYQLKADTSGWDANQVLRVPGTTNHGFAKDRDRTFDVTVEEISDRTLPIAAIKSSGDFKPLVAPISPSENLPSLVKVLGSHNWQDRFYDLVESEGSDHADRSGAICELAYLAAEAGCSNDEIYRVLYDTDARWKLYTRRKDRFRRLTDIVERARIKYPEGATPNFIEMLTGVRSVNEQGVEEVKPVVWGYRAFMQEDVKLEWQLKDLAPLQTFGIISGDPGVGKTQVALRMARSISTGQSFLDWNNVVSPQRSLFLSLEMHHTGLQHFLSRMDNTASESELGSLDQYLMIAPIARSIALETADGRSFLNALIEQHTPSWVFIDSLAKSTYKSLNDDDNARSFNDYVSDLRAKYGISLIVIHHSKKRGDKDTKAADDGMNKAYGSRYYSTDLDFMLSLYKKPTKTTKSKYIELEVAKLRYAEEPANKMLWRNPDDFSFHITDEELDEKFERTQTVLAEGLFGRGNA